MQDETRSDRTTTVEPSHLGVVPLKTGTRLRQYVIQETLGAGGFGIAYRAEHQTLKAKSYAIKEYFPRDAAVRESTLVRPTTTGGNLFEFGRERFLKEAEILALCSHPAIVDVVDYFEENGTAYAVMAFVPGVPMAHWLSGLGRPPTQDELDRLIAPVLGALEVVHAHKLLHRDIAPDNILVRSDGSPCLIDFGAARAETAAAVPNDKTAAFVKSGYSPPEQWLGQATHQGPWTDIYALAATLYRAVTGAPPPEAMARGPLGRTMPPTATSARGAYRESFLAAIDSGLELKPQDRPQSVVEWRERLMAEGPLLRPAGEATVLAPGHQVPISSPPGTRPPASQPSATPPPAATGPAPVASNIRLLPLAAVVALLLAAGAWWATRPPSSSTTVSADVANGDGTQKSAGQSAKGAKGASTTTKEAAVFGTSDVAASGAGETKQGGGTKQTLPTKQDIAGATSVSTTPSGLSAELRLAVQDCLSGPDDKRLAACRRIAAVPEVGGIDRARAQLALGLDARNRADFDGAIAAFDAAVALDANLAEAYHQRGLARFLKKADSRAAADHAAAIADYDRALQLEPTNAEALNNRAWAYFRTGRAARGLTDADIAVTLLPEKEFVWDTRGHINEQLGNRTQAIADFRRALALNPQSQSSRAGLVRLGQKP